MSPLALRRYRAERLLRRDFSTLRPGVLAQVARRLRALDVHLDEADLEACYAQAWHGLYATVLGGQEVATPTGWLVTVTVRRAIDDHRQRTAAPLPVRVTVAAPQPDPIDRVDDLDRLREVFEALRGRLSARECEAASLCYLQGLSRGEAAQRMGISRRRMDKLMDGMGAGVPGVASKVGVLLASIRGGRWCDEQASLMRGLAFGLLDPHGERYRLAVVHQRECPACRAYVASLRGLAAVLPPVSIPIPVVAGAAVVGANGVAAAGGAGAAGGGWWILGGPLATKVAATCLLAFSLGAGCVVLTRVAPTHRSSRAVAFAHPGRAGRVTRTVAVRTRLADLPAPPTVSADRPALAASTTDVAVAPSAPVRRTPRADARAGADPAAREFGVESLAARTTVASSPPVATVARVATSPPPTPVAPRPASSGPAAAQAEREFGVQ